MDIPEEVRNAFMKRYPECAGEMYVSEETWTKLSTFCAGWLDGALHTRRAPNRVP